MWLKESVGAREYGYRRADNLGYVGKAHAKGYWRAYVRSALDEPFRLLSSEGWSNDRVAQADADKWIDEKELVAA